MQGRVQKALTESMAKADRPLVTGELIHAAYGGELVSSPSLLVRRIGSRSEAVSVRRALNDMLDRRIVDRVRIGKTYGWFLMRRTREMEEPLGLLLMDAQSAA